VTIFCYKYDSFSTWCN